MATAKVLKKPNVDLATRQQEWLNRLDGLVYQIQRWAKDLGWSTRRIAKKMKDSEVGDYVAPALLLQEETTRVLLEPIARSAPGADGVVDLYLMPAYDDIASLYFSESTWQLHYLWPGTPLGNIRDAEHTRLSKKSFQKVLEEMKDNATQD